MTGEPDVGDRVVTPGGVHGVVLCIDATVSPRFEDDGTDRWYASVLLDNQPPTSYRLSRLVRE